MHGKVRGGTNRQERTSDQNIPRVVNRAPQKGDQLILAVRAKRFSERRARRGHFFPEGGGVLLAGGYLLAQRLNARARVRIAPGFGFQTIVERDDLADG